MDYLTLAEAVGEAEPRPLNWTAEEMAGWDDDDFEAARAAMDREAAHLAAGEGVDEIVVAP